MTHPEPATLRHLAAIAAAERRRALRDALAIVGGVMLIGFWCALMGWVS